MSNKLSIMAIPLSRGLFALVDGEDYEWLIQRKWYASKSGRSFYALAWKNLGQQKGKRLSMHREIVNPPIDMEIDHINDNGLDNRKVNLRICTSKQNIQNKRSYCNSTSQYKGVSWKQSRKRWIAIIKQDGRNKFLGSFRNETKAAKAYDMAAKQIFGKYARLNFLEQK